MAPLATLERTTERSAAKSDPRTGSAAMPMQRPVFRVENLGPIAEGEVELHPLTIFIGKNNTGKTYMAKSIYSAFKAVERDLYSYSLDLTPAELREALTSLRKHSPRRAADLLEPIAQQVQESMRHELGQSTRTLRDRLALYFGVAGLDHIKSWCSRDPLEVRVVSDPPGGLDLFALSGLQHESPLSAVGSSHGTPKESNHLASVEVQMLMALTTKDTAELERMAPTASTVIANYFWYEHVLGSRGLDGTARYLPAARSGLYEAGHDIISVLLKHQIKQRLPGGQEPLALGGMALDHLSELQQLPHHQTYEIAKHLPPVYGSGAGTIAAELAEVLGGSIVVEPSGGFSLPSIFLKTDEGNVPIQQASSMVAELAPLVALLGLSKWWPGDVLVIDEPEAHLHPEAMVAVAEALVDLAGAGVRVLCATHSSEFLHTVSNGMLRAAREDKAPGGGPSIKQDDFAVYDFAHDAKVGATIVKPVKIDPEWGIPEDDFFDVANRLGNEAARLINDF